MIKLPQYDIEKIVNDLLAFGGEKPVEMTLKVKADKNGSVKVHFLAETGLTTHQIVGGPTPEAMFEAVNANLQQLYLQLNTGTAKLKGKLARERLYVAAKLFSELAPGELSAFNDGDFVFCKRVAREDVKKTEEALKKQGWIFEQSKEDSHYALKPMANSKLPDNQHRISLSARIGPIAPMWAIKTQNGREVFEFWFDEVSR